MTRTVLLIGSKGALGNAVNDAFRRASWRRILCDVNAAPDDGELRIHIPRNGAEQQSIALHEGLEKLSVAQHTIDAVVNTSGGFSMDKASSDNIFSSLKHMYSSSVESSVVAAHVSSRYLAPGGLLVLPGSAACKGPTPWAVTYGATKAAVHHMVSSLGAASSGLPQGSTVVGIAPAMLDTPANRESMPKADKSTWTPLSVVADKILAWASDPVQKPLSGKVYEIVTRDHSTEFKIL